MLALNFGRFWTKFTHKVLHKNQNQDLTELLSSFLEFLSSNVHKQGPLPYSTLPPSIPHRILIQNPSQIRS
jgi:hypothetical protein